MPDSNQIVGINFEGQIREFSRSLLRFEREQLPFAVSLALNSTAFDFRRYLVGVTYPKAFTVRNKSLPRAAFRVKRSTKRKLVAVVFDRLEKDFLARQVSGAVKTPRSSSRLLVPTRNAKAKRTASGAIRKTFRGRNVKNSFVADLRGRGPALWQRKRSGLVMLYVLKPSVTIRARFRVQQDAVKVADRVLLRHFRTAWARALRTAR